VRWNVGLRGRDPEGPQLMRQSLGSGAGSHASSLPSLYPADAW